MQQAQNEIYNFIPIAIEMIKRAISEVSILPTLSPNRARIEFNNFFKKISIDHIINDSPNILGTPVNPPYNDTQKDSLIDQKLNVSYNSLTLGDFKTKWKNRIAPSKKFSNEFFYRNDEHVVDHILCHLKGYRVYENIEDGNRLRLKEFIRGRDIILTATMLAVPRIQRELKKIVLGVFT